MSYCLSVAIHNMYFDLAIVDNNHKIVERKILNYDKSKDISLNIYLAYNKYFFDYKIDFVGVAISNNIETKNGYIYNFKLMNLVRYNLKESLTKVFKTNVYVHKETDLAGLSFAYKNDCDYLLYLNIDNKITNSFVVNKLIQPLNSDIDISKSPTIYKCYKDELKNQGLKNDLDDEYVGSYFLSNQKKCIKIVSNWCFNLTEEVNRIASALPIKEITFSGYLGEYFEEFRKYIDLPINLKYFSDKERKENALIGISHLMFKDK